MTPTTKNKWIPVLLLFLPLFGALVSYAITNENRNTIQDERLEYHQQQLQEIKVLIKSNNEILGELNKTVSQQAAILNLLSKDHYESRQPAD